VNHLRLSLMSALLVCSAHAQREVPYSPLTDGSLPGTATLYGNCVAGGGDVDGDGVPDFAVGSPGFNMEDGRVYVYSGATGSLLYGGPLGPVPPVGITNGHYQFGCALDMSRDFTGDDRADILIGAQQNSGFTNRKGFVTLVDGETGTVVASWIGAPQDLLGSAVAAGDVDGDGQPDIIAGARNGSGLAGHVVVYSGVAPYGVLFVHASPSNVAFTSYGRSLAAGNVNGDAYADIMVGADQSGNPMSVGTGFIEVLLGPAGTPAAYGPLTGTLVGDQFGFSIANAGDVAGDGDGFDDILVGAPQYQSGESIGYAMVYDGLTGSQLFNFQGEQQKDYFGVSVAGGLDFNGDDTVDFVIGAHENQPAGERGYVRVHTGTPGFGPPFLYRRAGDKASVANAGSGVGIGRSLAAVGNTSSFTTDSFVAGSAVYAGTGHAEVISGRNLLLTVVPDSVSIGEIVSILTAQLPAGTPLILLGGLPPPPAFIHPILGVSLLPTSIFIVGMQASQSLLLSGTAPASLSGVQILLQMAGKPVGEDIRISDIQTIQL